MKKKTKLLMRVVILLEIVALVASMYLHFNGTFSKPRIMTSATLEKAIDVSDLSTAQFTYNGIAEIYKDITHKKIKCYIRYNAKVKAGINMEDVQFEIDNENMTVKPILPEVKITSNIIDEKSLSFIPESTSIELSEALTVCKEDAEREANESDELLSSAKENLESIIEALIYPIVSDQGYRIVYK